MFSTRFTGLLAVATLAFASPAALAQDANPLEVKPKAATVAPAAAAPARTEITRFEAWQVTCGFAADGARLGCTASLRINQEGTGRGLLVWNIGRGADGKLAQSVVTMPGVLIQPGVRLATAADSSVTLPYVSCASASCLAGGPLPDKLLAAAQKATALAFVLRGIDGRDYSFSFSPKGLGPAVAATLAK